MNTNKDVYLKPSELQHDHIYLDYIVNHLPHFIIWKNQHSVFLGCNLKFAQSVGFKSVNEIIGKTDFDMPWKHFANDYVADDQLIMETGTAKLNYEEMQQQLDGSYLTMLVSKVPMFNEQHEAIGVLAIYTDITERKKFEQQLCEAKEAAEAINQLNTQFIRNMEHDIRTPFSGIYSMTKALAESEPNAERRNYLEAIVCGAKELLDYCNKIIEFTKLKTGSLPVVHKPFNIYKLLNSVLHMEKLPATVKNLDLQVEYESDIPEVLLSDPYRIQSILINLTSNAIKYTLTGYIKIHVAVEKDSAGVVNFLVLTVEDSGSGIPQEVVAAIESEICSNEFVLSHNIKHQQGHGFVIIKQMLKELGAHLEIHSIINQGTKIYCKIPVGIMEHGI